MADGVTGAIGKLVLSVVEAETKTELEYVTILLLYLVATIVLRMVHQISKLEDVTKSLARVSFIQ